MKYDTIVIGGGLAGLTAGATLTKFGKKSTTVGAAPQTRWLCYHF